MRISILLLFSFLVNYSIFGQSFELKNNIEIIVKLDGEQCLVHTVEEKQTLYNISHLYNIPIKTLLHYNKLSSKDVIHKDNKIYIPLNHKIYSKKIKSNKNNIHLKPVVYVVRPKDNVYAITHRYFKIDEKTFYKNNQLENNNLSIGKQLVIGWIAFNDQYSEWENKTKAEVKTTIKTKTEVITTTETQEIIVHEEKEEIVNTLPIKKTQTENQTDSTSLNKEPNMEVIDSSKNIVVKPNKEYIHESGIALWNKNSSDKTNSFVLHATAKINSVIELYNPVTRRTAYAKVIAHIPSNTYESDIAILISPKVAERLGALDERLKIKMTYYK